MLAWFTIQRLKLIGIGALVFFAVWWHQRAVTIAYRQGATDRERSTLVDEAVKIETAVKQRTIELDQREAGINTLSAQIKGERAALNQAGKSISDTLLSGLSQLSVQGVELRHEVQTVPDDAVNGRFRESLKRSRDSELERAADSR